MSMILLTGVDRPFGREIAARLATDGTVVTSLPNEGSLDALVINLPVTRDGTRFADISDGQLAAALDAMVFEVVETVQTALPRLAPGARIVVVNARGHIGAWGGAHLMAASAALMGLVRAMALEFAPRGITCNALAPDFVGERWDTPVARREIAEAVVFLTRPGQSLLSGQTLLLDALRGLRMSEARQQ